MARDFSRARAILIGNGHFTHQKIDDLPARNCLAAMNDLLTDELCGWPAGRIVQIEDAATRSDLALRVGDAVKDVEGLLVVYYVGHGYRTWGGRLALALRETIPDPERMPHTAMPYEELVDILSGCRAAAKIIILDCCLAELGNKEHHVFNGSELYFIGASKLNESAKSPPDSGLTAFTNELVGVVRDGIPGQGTELRLEQIYRELRSRLVSAGYPEPVDMRFRGGHLYPFAANAAAPAAVGTLPEASSDARLSRDVREKYRDVVRDISAQTGRAPDWSLRDWEDLCASPDQVAPKLRHATAGLRDATEAKPVFAAVVRSGLETSQLRHLYYLALGRWPAGESADALLVEAAMAGIAERGHSRRSGRNPPDVSALARFILCVADEGGHTPTHPTLSRWLTSIGHSVADAQAYLRDEGKRPAWLLITLTGMWPTEVSGLLISGDREVPFPATCEPSREGLTSALREILAVALPVRAVVDLEMPAELLPLGIERWHLIPSGGSYESLSDHHQPRLRWSGRHQYAEEARRARVRAADWAGGPVELQSTDGDVREAVRRQLWARPNAPYVVGRHCEAGASLDLLRAALLEGCSFILWFPAGAEGEIVEEVVRRARGVQVRARRHLLPDAFLAMEPVPPTVIWDDPNGRAGYKLPRAAAEGPS